MSSITQPPSERNPPEEALLLLEIGVKWQAHHFVQVVASERLMVCIDAHVVASFGDEVYHSVVVVDGEIIHCVVSLKRKFRFWIQC